MAPSELYEFELNEKENFEKHNRNVEEIKRIQREQELQKTGNNVSRKPIEKQPSLRTLVKAASSQSDDILVEIRNEDMAKRISKRNNNECLFDNLLSGTTATLMI